MPRPMFTLKPCYISVLKDGFTLFYSIYFIAISIDEPTVYLRIAMFFKKVDDKSTMSLAQYDKS